ncbi:MAG: aldo/keto reductase [Candidatus Micrarchaeia archaeon]
MKMKKFGNTGKEVSKIGIGTWQLAGNMEENIAVLKYALDNGINFIDTAEIYGTEHIVGKAIEGFDRENLFIATKVWTSHFSYADVVKACDESLKKLGTFYVDLYQLHWPSKTVDIKETMKAMEKLVDDGKIRSIGVSNFSKDELLEAEEAASPYGVISNQVEYSIIERKIEGELYDYCMQSGIEIISYSPLSHGRIFEDRELVKLLDGVGKKYDKTAAQVALNWLVSKNTIPIPKAGSIVHMKEDIESADFELSKDDLEAINTIYEKKYKRLQNK